MDREHYDELIVVLDQLALAVRDLRNGTLIRHPSEPRLTVVPSLSGEMQWDPLLGFSRFPPDSIPSSLWDVDSDMCSICGSEFSFLFRRHHCRTCGVLCCAHCCRSFVKVHDSVMYKIICSNCLEKFGRIQHWLEDLDIHNIPDVIAKVVEVRESSKGHLLCRRKVKMLEGGPDRALSFNAEYLPHQESSSFDAEYLASLECLRLRQAARTRTRSAKSTEFEGPRPHIRSNSDEALARHEGPRPHIRSNSDEALARQEDSELFDSELFDSELFVTARGADPSMEESKGLPYMMSPRNRRPDYFSMLCADSRLPNPTTDQGKNDSNAHPFEALVNRLALLAGSMQM